MTERRIAVDARPLCHPGTGIYRYSRELLTRMCPLGGEWFFYSPQRYDTAGFDLPNVHHCVAGVPAALRASQLAQFFYPRWARRDSHHRYHSRSGMEGSRGDHAFSGPPD